jgi:hypothetical protein
LKKALTKVSTDLNAKRAKAEATHKEDPDKMAAHTARTKHSLNLDKMQGEKKVKLEGREQDMNLCEAAWTEA